MPEIILSAKNLHKSYGKRLVINGIDIDLYRSEIVGLLGPNGAGKTTTFHMISGLVETDKGSIELNSRDITSLPMYKRSRLGLSYLAQEPSIFRNLSVENNLLGILETVEFNKIKCMERLNELIDNFSLGKVRKQLALTLSGGERRRLEIARCLCTKPSFLMLDEPFSGVDPIAVAEIKGIILDLQKKGLTILITDHNVRETLDIVDRAYIVYQRKILAQGKSSDLINDSRIQDIYIGDSFKI